MRQIVFVIVLVFSCVAIGLSQSQMSSGDMKGTVADLRGGDRVTQLTRVVENVLQDLQLVIERRGLDPRAHAPRPGPEGLRRCARFPL